MRLSNDQSTLRSEFADDPDMAGIVALFIHELPQRLAAMHVALAAANHEQLRMLAHQLKGAAGGYGFPKLGEAAALIDQAVRAGNDDNVIRSRVGMLAAGNRGVGGGECWVGGRGGGRREEGSDRRPHTLNFKP